LSLCAADDLSRFGDIAVDSVGESLSRRLSSLDRARFGEFCFPPFEPRGGRLTTIKRLSFTVKDYAAFLSQDLGGIPRRTVLALPVYNGSLDWYDLPLVWYDIVPGTTKQSRMGKNGLKRAHYKMREVPVKSDKDSTFNDRRFSVAPMMDWTDRHSCGAKPPVFSPTGPCASIHGAVGRLTPC
jgi:hypothetical protein